mgnify:FL=1
MATLYTQQDKNISEKKRFFAYKTNRVLLIVLMLLVIAAIKIMIQMPGTYFPMLNKQVKKDETNTLPKVEEWITTDFAHGCAGPCEDYAVNISYPSDYKFGCCGDTEAGTYHTVQVPDMEATGVQILEGANFCYENSDTECSPVEPEYFYKNKIDTGDVVRIEDIETDHLGSSVFAVKGVTDEWATNTPYENYIFAVFDEDAQQGFKYYSVQFMHPENMSTEFKTKFLNLLEMWSPSKQQTAYLTNYEKRSDGNWYLSFDAMHTLNNDDWYPTPEGWKISNTNMSAETFRISPDLKVQIDSEDCVGKPFSPNEMYENFSDYVFRLQKTDFYYWNKESDAKYGWQFPGFYFVTIKDGVVTEMIETYNNCGA